MRILIITHGRTGSTMLMHGLSKLYSLTSISEPFNQRKWASLKRPMPDMSELADNIVVKTMAFHNEEWNNSNLHKFDKVIYLIRDNIRDTIISKANAVKYGFNNLYHDTEDAGVNDMRFVLDAYRKVITSYEQAVNSGTTSPVLWWYNDIYYTEMSQCKKLLESINPARFDASAFKLAYNDYFHPKRRYRQK